jgi:SAM-dependent methyltransferase
LNHLFIRIEPGVQTVLTPLGQTIHEHRGDIMANYVLDNAAAETEQRFASLESSYDPFTIRQLEEIGVAPGWRCLEVGGGGGSIARWLADRAGPQGQVVVTDINPRWLGVDRPNIEMRRHDIVADALEPDAFDLAHERLVLQHLPARRQAFERMIHAVKPGGWVLIEDFDVGWLPLSPRCEPADAALFTKVMNAFARMLVEADVDLDLGRRLCSLLREYGLRDVEVEAHAQIWTGGSSGCRLHRANIEQLRDRVAQAGPVTDVEFERFYELIEDPAFSVNSYMLVSARGRRPAS